MIVDSAHTLSRVCLLRRYMHSFYFAITTLTTVGYGDINATNSMEMAFLSVRSQVLEVITLLPPSSLHARSRHGH